MSAEELLDLLCSLEREGERQVIAVQLIQSMAAASIKHLLPLVRTRFFAAADVPVHGNRICSLQELEEEEETVRSLEAQRVALERQVEDMRQSALVKRHIWSEFNFAQSHGSTPRSWASPGRRSWGAPVPPRGMSRGVGTAGKGGGEEALEEDTCIHREEDVLEEQRQHGGRGEGGTGGYRDPFFAGAESQTVSTVTSSYILCHIIIHTMSHHRRRRISNSQY